MLKWNGKERTRTELALRFEAKEGISCGKDQAPIGFPVLEALNFNFLIEAEQFEVVGLTVEAEYWCSF